MSKETRTCVSAYAYSFGTDAAVDLDVFLRETGPQLSYFGDTPIEEFLATAPYRAKMSMRDSFGPVGGTHLGRRS